MRNSEPRNNLKLVTLVNHLRQNVPFYQDFGSEFLELPIVSRSNFIREPGRFISISHKISPDRLLHLIQRHYEAEIDSRVENGIIIERTSGSSGLPLVIPKAVEERVSMAEAIWRSRSQYDSQVSVRNYLPVVNSGVRSRFRFDTADGCRSFWKYVAHAQVRWIHATPNIFRKLAEHIDTRGTDDVACYAESTGQNLEKADQELVESRLKLKVINQYACREVWVIGNASSGGGFNLLSENIHLEILDDHDHPVQDGVDGRVVVTSLKQYLFPFVRYDTGDRGSVSLDATERKVVRLNAHRPQDALLGSTSRISGAGVFKTVFKQVYTQIGSVRLSHVQIYQRDVVHFEIAIENNQHAQLIRSLVETFFNRMKLLPSAARFELVVLTTEEVAKLASSSKVSLFSNVALARRRDAL